MNIYIETYGCAANQNDSEIMSGLLSRAGFIVVNNEDNADLIIVNTCTVKHTTENKIMHRIKQLSEKNKKLIIAGCMPETQYGKLRDINKKTSLIGANSITNIVNTVKKTMDGKTVENFEKGKDKICLPKIHQNKIIDIVQVSEGCLSNCSFCICKHARGKLYSYKPENIVKEIKKSKKAGIKEFWLTSQDCGCYGFDINTNITELLNKITTEVAGNYYIRLGMIHPIHLKKIYKQLASVMKHNNIFKFLHVPVQSGSNKILKKMKRNHTIKEFVDIINYFKKQIPKITIWTDVIVGFPGETKEDFFKTQKLIKKIEPDFVNVSRYSTREETEAKKMKQLETEVKKKRSKIMTKLVDKYSLKNNKKWIDKTCNVLVDEYNKKNKNYIGRNSSYKPVILEKNRTGNNISKIGNTGKVKITDAIKTGLKGQYLR